jgi:hypothetical protein
MKKLITWLLVAFLVFYIVTKPGEAANVLRSIGNGLKAIAIGMGNFVSGLA